MTNRHFLLRPVSWSVLIILLVFLEFAAELIFLLGSYLVSLLSGLSTLVVIILVMAFGSMYLCLVSYSVFLIPMLIVMASDKIYPSNHAFRYYFVGILGILVFAFLIIAGIVGMVSGGVMFWFYARCAYVIVGMIALMIYGHQKAEERHEQMNK